jgi:hypothetical protein
MAMGAVATSFLLSSLTVLVCGSVQTMSSFFEIAAPLAERGFRVFPLIPRTKRPVKFEGADHFDAATTDSAQLRAWGEHEPSANVALSPDEHFCFLETDDERALREACANLPAEVFDTARVSARDNRCYFVFRQTMRTKRAGNMTATREGLDNLFEFKQHRVYVTGPGSIHPKTGTQYLADWRTIPAMPDVLLNRLCELYGAPKATVAQAMTPETARQTALLDRFLEVYEVAVTGEWFNKGKQWYRPIECPWGTEHENNSGGSSTCIVYNEGGGYGFDCKHRCASKTWQEFRAELERRFPDRRFSFVDTPEIALGKTQATPLPEVSTQSQEGRFADDWEAFYHSADDVRNAPPVSFIIDQFLAMDGITALAAPVAQRKSLVALNIAHAACTGEPLFGRFAVTRRPSRVLYLCPEMGLHSFSERLRKIGLMDYVGKSLFCRTLSAPGELKLDDLSPASLQGALVIVDTAVRYLEGDENASADMRKFAASVFRLLKEGAVSVLLLHHSAKGTKDTSELTLENSMRGSGELGAFVASCWATRLQDPADPYNSRSYLVNVKQRDFESKPFEVIGGPDCRMRYVEQDGDVTLKSNQFKGNRDGQDEAAVAILKANPDDSVRGAVERLGSLGIRRGKDWVAKQKSKLKGTGSVLSSA